MKFGLLGRKLGHSYSPQIHAMLGNPDYTLFEKEPEVLEDFLKNGSFQGINVTIPYKKAVIPFCSSLSPRAEALGAVNTIVRRADGSLLGHNTDYYGFSSMLRRSGLQVQGQKVLILGSGGAAVTVNAVLREAGARPVIISRSGPDNYNNLDLHRDAYALVNATPVGMAPNPGKSPIDLDTFPRLQGVLDLIYNPSRTRLLMDAEQRGLITENGLWMLTAQAKESAEWFLNKTISETEISRIYGILKSQMENIILIGMPGAGKSTVGAMIAKKLGRPFYDADQVIAQKAGMSIPQIFASSGEEGFRRLETEALTQLGARSGIVLSTGGGCVTRPENYPLLHQNGTIVRIKRSLDQLSTEGRPLSSPETLEKMARLRSPLYDYFADITADNTGAAQETADYIVQKVML